MTRLDEIAQVLATSNGTPWDFVLGGADVNDPYYRDAAAVIAYLDKKDN